MKVWTTTVLMIGLIISLPASSQIIHGVIAHAQHKMQPSPIPIASYNMDSAASPMLDGVGSADGTCSSCPTFVSGGGPNGSGSYLFANVPSPNEEIVTIPGALLNLHVHNSFTIAYDFKGAALGVLSNLIGRQGQVDLGGDLGGSGGTILFINDSGLGGDRDVFTDGSEADNTWHNVAFVFSGTDIKAYVDGVLNATSGATTGTMNANTNNITVSDISFTQFVGALDNLQFFDVALTADQVAEIAGVDL